MNDPQGKIPPFFRFLEQQGRAGYIIFAFWLILFAFEEAGRFDDIKFELRINIVWAVHFWFLD